MKYLLVGFALILAATAWLLAPSSAQQGSALVLTTCGSMPQVYARGSVAQPTVNTSGQICL